MPLPSTSDGSAPDRVRLTVVSGTRRTDLVVPGAVPVAELLPALARGLGLLDVTTVHGGYRLITSEGRELGVDTGLVGQQVADGALLVLAARVDEAPPRVYDDVVEAVADVVERELAPRGQASGRRTARAAAALLLGFGMVALLSQRGSTPAGLAAIAVTVGLLAAAVHLSRARQEPGTAIAVIWLGAAYAAAAGVLLADRAPPGLAVAAAGAGVLLTGLAGVVVPEGRAMMAPPAVAGTVFLATGLVVRGAALPPAVMLTTVLVLAVMSGSVLPWLALDAVGTRAPPLHSAADVTADPSAIDPAGITVEVRAAHEILVGLSASVGLLLVLIAPLAVSLGIAGTAVALLSCLVLMLRTRQYSSGTAALVGLVSGLAGLVSVAGAVLWLHPDWRPAAAAALTVGGGALLAATLLPATPSARRSRLGEVAESVSLLLLPPLLVDAVGLLAAVRG